MTSTVFVSSTFLDLQTHRKEIWSLLRKLDLNIRGMEEFGARTDTPLQTCLTELDQADIYLGIIAFRLGSIDPNTGKSYTQLEYERAHSSEKEILIYLIDQENARTQRKYIDLHEPGEKLDAFKKTLRERHTVENFVDESDLVQKIQRDLSRHIKPAAKITTEDEDWAASEERLLKYFIVPKSLAGKEILLRIKIVEKPYAASSEICEAFNMEPGATAGMRVKLVRPNSINQLEFPDLYIPSKLLSNMPNLGVGDEIEGFMYLHFSPKQISKLRAQFRPRIEYPNSPTFGWHGSTINSIMGKPTHHPADQCLAIELSSLIHFKTATSA